MKGKIVWKSWKQEAMNTIKQQKCTWSCSCKRDIPGKRLLQRQDFTLVERPHIVWCKRYRRGEKPLFRTEGMDIRPNCEKLCFNGWLRPAAWLHRYQAERCKRHCKNGLAGVSSLEERCKYCSKAFAEYPLVLIDNADQTVYHVACALELATDIMVDLFTFFSPPAPSHPLYILTAPEAASAMMLRSDRVQTEGVTHAMVNGHPPD